MAEQTNKPGQSSGELLRRFDEALRTNNRNDLAKLAGEARSSAALLEMRDLLREQLLAVRKQLRRPDASLRSDYTTLTDTRTALYALNETLKKDIVERRKVEKETKALYTDLHQLHKANTLYALAKKPLAAAFGAAAPVGGGTELLGGASGVLMRYIKQQTEIAKLNKEDSSVPLPSGVTAQAARMLGKMIFSSGAASFAAGTGLFAGAAQIYGKMFSTATGMTGDLVNALGINPLDRYRTDLSQQIIRGDKTRRGLTFGPKDVQESARGMLGVRGMAEFAERSEFGTMALRFSQMGRIFGMENKEAGAWGGRMMSDYALRSIKDLDSALNIVGASAKRLGVSFKDMSVSMQAYARDMIYTTGRSFEDIGTQYVGLSNFIQTAAARGYGGEALRGPGGKAMMAEAMTAMGSRVTMPEAAAFRVLGGETGKNFHELMYESAKMSPLERLASEVGAYGKVTGGNAEAVRSFAMLHGGASPVVADVLAKMSVDKDVWKGFTASADKTAVMQQYASQNMQLSSDALADLANSLEAQRDPLRIIAKAVERIEYFLSFRLVQMLPGRGGLKLIK